MKKKSVVSLVLVMTFLLSMTTTVSAQGREKVIETDGLKIDIPIYAKTYAYLTLKDFEEEGIEDAKDFFENAGWVFEKDHMYKVVRLMGGDIEINGKNYLINKDGLVSLDISENTSYLKSNELSKKIKTEKNYITLDDLNKEEIKTNLLTTNVYFTDKPVETTITNALEINAFSSVRNIKKQNYDLALVIEEDIFELLDHMDEQEEEMYKEMASMSVDFESPGHGTPYKVGDQVHCNRFNGPRTDDVHYSKAKDPAKTLRNFEYSDCATCLGSGISFCRKSDKCNQLGPGSRAACSTFTIYSDTGKACPKTYHRHYQFECQFDTERWMRSPWYGY
ncbi:hypothetical protein [Tissierella praeacuta]|uniref:hypothetical protein n=1 Tax=Tissierella praeacuta TaxID=43131 RepID=UPI00333E5900